MPTAFSATACLAMGLSHGVLRAPPTQPLSVADLSAALAADPAITHVMAVHCETSSGILNPIGPISDLCRKAGRKLLIDAVSSFGAIPIDLRAMACEALILGSNKCLQGPPGLAWVIARLDALRAAEGNARSLTLDLWDQWRHFEMYRSFRFTPPTHVIVALAQALREHRSEGGQEARLKRYTQNRDCLVGGMRALGFESLLPETVAAPIVATFVPPERTAYDSVTFCQRLAQNGFLISLRRAAVPNTLRIGCIGDVTHDHMAAAVAAVRRVLADMEGPVIRDNEKMRRAN